MRLKMALIELMGHCSLSSNKLFIDFKMEVAE